MSSNYASSSNSVTNGGAVNCIEHRVSKMDTLAGVAIKYGVEVADVKRMNGLVTDLQMFALKSLRIPLPGRHPPSPSISDGPATSGERIVEHIPPRRVRSEVLKSLESLGFSTQQRRVSPAMSSLQGYYGLKTPNGKSLEEGTEMAVYKTGRADYLENDMLPKPLPVSDPSPSQHKFRSLANGFLPENGELAMDVADANSRDGEAEKSNENSVRRRQKADADMGPRTPEENSGGSGSGRNPALRPKSVSRNDADISWLNPIPVGLGDSLMANGFVGVVRKSSSTSNLQDQEKNGSPSMWPTSRWSLKPDLQVFSATSITRPIFDGLPKPVSGRRNKAALD